jgi:urocanate hydratase
MDSEKIKKSPEGGLFVTSGLGGMSGAQSGYYCRLHRLCRRKSKITNTSQSRAGLTEIIEDLDKLVSRVALAKPTTSCVNIFRKCS